MKVIVRHIISWVLIALFCVGMALLMRRTSDEMIDIPCQSIQIHFLDSLKFVSEDEIKSYLDSKCGPLVGKKIDSLELYRIEDVLDSRSAIMKSEAWTEVWTEGENEKHGVLNISITQRAPVVRFLHSEGGFYTDRDGFIFPLHSSFTADVPVVKGNIPVRIGNGYKGEAPDEESRMWIRKVIDLVSMIQRSKAWSGRFSEITVDANGDIVLKASEGKESFILGKPDNLDEKLSKIERYYSQIRPNVGEDYYKSVNLKFNNQIICRQKDI